MRTFAGIEEITASVGETLGSSEWLLIDQDRIDRFADATGDHQWIHCDPDKAKDGPYGTTIAHGYLTLSLLPVLMAQVFFVDGVRMRINYGLDKVRFPSPVPVGSEIRATVVLSALTPLEGGAQAHLTSTIEVKGASKPACFVESIARYSV